MILPTNTIIIICLILTLASGSKLSSLESYNNKTFADNLFSTMVEGRSSENLVFSPISIQTILGLAYTGAEGQTAEDLRKVFKLKETNKTRIAENFGKVLGTLTETKQSNEIVKPQLNIANRIYIAENRKLAKEFNKIAFKYFQAEVKSLDFNKNQLAANEINKWISEQTDNKIRDLITAYNIDSDTAMILVNAIYFKALWLNPFDKELTKLLNFHINRKQDKKVETMYNEEFYRYAEIQELNAKVLELPYDNSNISMLIILPNEIEGLQLLETKLKNMNINDIYSKLKMKYVEVYLPKFRIEYNIDLKDPLEKLGLSSIFTETANFNGFLEATEKLHVSKAVHKAFLNVDENGSEAGASTYLALTPHMLISTNTKFNADHPFVFVICSETNVYFAGHVAEL